MAAAIASLKELYQAKEDLEHLKKHHEDLYEQLLHVVSLTRQLQIKYGYMASIVMDEEDLPGYRPQFVRDSILTLYQQEVEALKNHQDINEVKAIMHKHRNISDSKLFLLILGMKPELLQGSTIIK
ncbi:hypothetical protein [Thalassobacillus sp. CUG 92003]|uniref:hypothetical protein n=1 Tax=Thalassobacillus sp. CUG 92003 TaxID=2736641 RepID=UPI0015E644A7|nr:hypothetical protein [Thalassobacillus sp. CUG 92003]